MADPKYPGPGQGLDTGTGGFPASDGKAHTYDIGVDEPSQVDWSPGQVKVSKSMVDLSPGTRQTLASYLSSTTLGSTRSSGGQKPNKYPVYHAPAEVPIPGTLRDAAGNTAPLTPYSFGNSQPHFADVTPGDSRSSDAANLNIVRGAAEPPNGAVYDGNTLLPAAVAFAPAPENPPPPGTLNFSKLQGIDPNTPVSPVKTYTEGVIGKNTYSVDKLFLQAGQPFVLRLANTLKTTTFSPMPQQDKTPADLAVASSYLVNITKNGESPMSVGNIYPIDAVTIQAASLETAGYPTLPISNLTPGQTIFAKDLAASWSWSSRSSFAEKFNILRGRQKPEPSTDATKDKSVDGNFLLTSAVVSSGAASPPPRGTANFSKLVDAPKASPVKIYTDGVLGGNSYTPSSNYLEAGKTVPLRPANKIASEPFVGLTTNGVDVPKARLKTLSDYLGNITKTGPGQSTSILRPTEWNFAGNPYPVDVDPGGTAQTLKLLDPLGLPTLPQASPENQKTFVDFEKIRSRSSAAARLDPLGVPAALALRNGGEEILREAIPGELDGKDQLGAEAQGGSLPQLKTTVVTSTNKILQDYYGPSSGGDVSKSVIYNRFNPDAPFETGLGVNASRVEYSADGASGIEKGRNTWDPTGGSSRGAGLGTKLFARKYTMGTSIAERDVTFGQLAQLGSALSFRSSVELGSAPEDVGNPSGDGAETRGLVPGAAQLGLYRPNREELEARSFIDFLKKDGISDGISESVVISPAGVSWGTLNNVHDQFSGITNWGMQLLAVAMLLALVVIIGVFALLMKLISPGNGGNDKFVTDDLGRPFYGAFRDDPSKGDYTSIAGIIKAIIGGKFNFWRAIGLIQTRHQMGDCIAIGSLAFFGIDPSGDTSSFALLLDVLKEGPLSVAQQPGYYSIMARNISRSFVAIGDAFRNLGKAFATGALSGVKALFGMLDVFRESKFFRAINVFARLGDDIIEDKSVDEEFLKDMVSTGFTRRHPSKIDSVDGRTNDAASRERLGGTVETKAFSRTLAWSSYRAPDMLIMPTGYGQAAAIDGNKKLGAPSLLPTIAPDPGGKNGLKYGGIYVGSDSGRIPTENREMMEEALEAEYVPFYLHDVRTNEIISFHAFLASLSDDYSPSYDSFDAFGRVEPIKTYKGTQRKIGFSFYISATNPADFNSMWLKINKLTTMVYPQFSEGRGASMGKNSFYAPFSQTIQASPMIRLRIGDLIRSNYSKFHLARLFGATYAGTTFDGNTVETSVDAKKKEYVNRLETESGRTKAKIETAAPGNTYFTTIQLFYTPPKGIGLPLPVGNSAPPPEPQSLPVGLCLELVKEIPDKPGWFQLKVVEAKGEDKKASAPDPTQIPVSVAAASGAAGSKRNVLGTTFDIHISNLEPTPTTEIKITEKIQEYLGTKGISTAYMDAVNDFMIDNDPQKGNAISRSFRSSGGKGLAGFIESMNFDWYDRVTWEIGAGVDNPQPQRGRRAPKMCKVTISFSPIHDITPGLDHLGMNRAPIYPVGSSYANDIIYKSDS